VSYEVPTSKQEVSAVDIHTMGDLSAEDYNRYIRENLIYVDHHDILRSMAAGYPLAVTKAQMQTLMEYLRELAPTVGEQ
jgi:hypothetical protein